jgi:hypothetical protein
MEKQIEKKIGAHIASRIAKWIAISIAAIIAITIFILIGGKVVQLLWNWLMPTLFGLRELTFGQAIGLLALSRILFGGFGRGGGYRPRRWGRDSSEDRERLRQRLRDRCGMGGPTGENAAKDSDSATGN